MGVGGSKKGKERQKSEKRSPEAQKMEIEQTPAEAQDLSDEGYVQATVAKVSQFGDNE